MPHVTLKRTDGKEPREQVLQLDIAHVGNTLVVSSKYELWSALISSELITSEFDLLVDGHWFRRCAVAKMAEIATLDYIDVD